MNSTRSINQYLNFPNIYMAESYSKKSRQKKKAQKKKEKLLQREERKANNNKGKGLEDMLAYVDEFGNITDVPPEQQNREKVNLEDIQLGAAPIEELKELTGTVTSFFTDKAYGFIVEDISGESIFVHANSAEEPIEEKDRVSFEKERTPKGYAAINVKKLK